MWLVFVDTNIFLDLYRQGGDSAERQLTALERHQDSLIIGEQIRMEYLKNRQKVILQGQKNIKNPERPFVPPILTDYQPAKSWKKRHQEAVEQAKKVQAKIDLILKDPLHHDRLFQALMRIFKHKSDYNLGRDHKKALTVRGRARKRFTLGYPPRKDTDTSIGDAINWEWLVCCAQDCPDKPDILIVSRDSDYGTMCGADPVLNDWLKREFQERVSKKRKIELTNKLTYALEKLEETVSEADVEAEEAIIQQDAEIRNALATLGSQFGDDNSLAILAGLKAPSISSEVAKILAGLKAPSIDPEVAGILAGLKAPSINSEVAKIIAGLKAHRPEEDENQS
jgi:predicted nucleic acid-binding protein